MTKFSELHPETRNRRVHEFMVWRVGSSVNWDCTQEEIAREVGVTPVTVSTICRARGWKTRGKQTGGYDRLPVDALMRNTDPRITGHA